MSKDSNTLQDLFAAQAHLGHKTNRVHPKAKKYIYSVDNGVSIIDLTQTAPLLEKAVAFAQELGKEAKRLVVVGTKKIASPVVLELTKKYNVQYVAIKWPPGLLTNFESMKSNLKRIKDLKTARDNGEWESLIKFEQSRLSRELGKLERVYGGIVDLDTIPDALFIIDLKKEKNALIEAHKSSLPVIAITDTNTDPSSVKYPIPANDDSATSIVYILEKVLTAYSKGKGA